MCAQPYTGKRAVVVGAGKHFGRYLFRISLSVGLPPSPWLCVNRLVTPATVCAYALVRAALICKQAAWLANDKDLYVGLRIEAQ